MSYRLARLTIVDECDVRMTSLYWQALEALPTVNISCDMTRRARTLGEFLRSHKIVKLLSCFATFDAEGVNFVGLTHVGKLAFNPRW